MFGVATRRKRLSIEMRARNALALLPDASGTVLARRPSRPAASALRLPVPRSAACSLRRGSARVPAQLSRDAGRYLCNYVCWRGAVGGQSAAGRGSPPSSHVRQLRRTPRRARSAGRQAYAADLARAGEAILMALAAAARR